MSLNVKSRFTKVWEVKETEYGKRIDLGTSRKDQNGNYINCNWFGCRFVGSAKEFGEGLKKGDLIKIDSGQLENVYKKETGKTYFNLTVFEASYESAQAPVSKEKFEEKEEEFPF